MKKLKLKYIGITLLFVGGILSCIGLIVAIINKDLLASTNMSEEYQVAIVTDDDFIGSRLFIADDNKQIYTKLFFDEYIAQHNLLVADSKIIFEHPEYRVTYDGTIEKQRLNAVANFDKYRGANGQGDGYYYFAFDRIIHYYDTNTGEVTTFDTDQYPNKTYIPGQEQFIGLVSITNAVNEELYLSITTSDNHTIEPFAFDYTPKPDQFQRTIGFNSTGTHFFTNTVDNMRHDQDIFSDLPLTKYNFTDKNDVTVIDTNITYTDNEYQFAYGDFGNTHLSLTAGGELFKVNLDTEQVTAYDVRDKLVAEYQNYVFYDVEQDIVYLASADSSDVVIYDITNDALVGEFEILAENYSVTGFAVSKQ
ncbi:hypothetical protein RZE82_05615 [Mollicutes bacterium LVI A0039]|nr:hypothetical protein RZE82_05615 [Mollicutes bacterium LVI A0039]